MIHTIRVQTTKGPDLVGEGLLREITHHFGSTGVKKVATAKVYRVEGLNIEDAKQLTEAAFCEAINQGYTLNAPLTSVLSLRERKIREHVVSIEIAYKPGVMNPEVSSILKSARDLGFKNLKAADSSREYAFFGKVTSEELQTIIKKLNLYNPITEHVVENIFRWKAAWGKLVFGKRWWCKAENIR